MLFLTPPLIKDPLYSLKIKLKLPSIWNRHEGRGEKKYVVILSPYLLIYIKNTIEIFQ